MNFSCIRENEYELESIRNSWKQELQDLEFAKSSLERQKMCLEGELAAAQEELRGLKMAVSHLSSVQASLESQLSAVKVYMFEVHYKMFKVCFTADYYVYVLVQ